MLWPKCYVGEKNRAKNGLEMEIIASRNSDDLDIRFSDGVIVYHKRHSAFKQGRVAHPNIKPMQFSVIDRTGETGTASNGMTITVLNYRTARSIDVQFEDGTIVRNKSYNDFKLGYISHPSINKNTITAKSKIREKANERIGQQVVNKYGDVTTLIAYRSASNVDIQFEDGTIVKTSYQAFKAGTKTKRSIPKDSWNKTGQTVYSNAGILMEIVQYRKATDLDVKFEDGTILTGVSYGQFSSGQLKHPNFYKSTTKNEWHVGDWIITGLAFKRESGQGEFYCYNTKTMEQDVCTIEEILNGRA